MFKSAFIIYTLGQLTTFLILGLKYEMFSLSYSSQCYYILLSLILIGLVLVLTQKSPGQFNENIEQFQTSFQNIQQNYSQRNNNQHKIFCQVCKSDQNLRSFHCQTCKKCIPTYDHHCGFLGKCIGQKNRQIFYLFCVFQTIQALLILVFLVNNLIETGNKSNDRIILISLSLIVTFLMATLLTFETYFMVCNITMNQFKKENKNQKKSKKYPYSRGLLKNLQQFWILGFKKELINWQKQIKK